MFLQWKKYLIKMYLLMATIHIIYFSNKLYSRINIVYEWACLCVVRFIYKCN